MKFCKKASLNLSINAIVILILAITMLGLGLAFMRNIFGTATQEFTEVTGTVKKQMIDQMKASTKVVDLSRPKVELKTGDNTQVYIGFLNEGSGTESFSIDAATSEATSLTGSGNCLTLDVDPTTSNDEVYLEYKKTDTEVLTGDVVVLPINIKAESGASPDTCFYELKITHGGVSDTIELTVDITQG